MTHGTLIGNSRMPGLFRRLVRSVWGSDSRLFSMIPACIYGFGIPKIERVVFPVMGLSGRDQVLADGTNHPGLAGVLLETYPDAPVRCVARGLVVHVDDTPGSEWRGLVVVAHRVGHGDIFHSFYAHIVDVGAREGDVVSEGQVVGHVRRSDAPYYGVRPGSYLHFAVLRGLLPRRAYVVERGRSALRWPDPLNFIANLQDAIRSRGGK